MKEQFFSKIYVLQILDDKLYVKTNKFYRSLSNLIICFRKLIMFIITIFSPRLDIFLYLRNNERLRHSVDKKYHYYVFVDEIVLFA